MHSTKYSIFSHRDILSCPSIHLIPRDSLSRNSEWPSTESPAVYLHKYRNSLTRSTTKPQNHPGQCLRRYILLNLLSPPSCSRVTCPLYSLNDPVLMYFQPVPLARSQIQSQIREQQLIALGFTTAIDAPNRITTPKESFVASEGIYTLREEVTLSIPPPHPSEPLIMQPNPIGTQALPVTAGSQAIIINAFSSSARQNGFTDSGSIASGISGQSSTSDGAAAAAGIYAPLSPVSKRKKPKNNIAKTNSSFVSRIITHENFQKRLNEKKIDDVYAFVNVSRAYEWLDLTTADKVHWLAIRRTHDKATPIAKLLFTKAHPTCHDINSYTRTNDHIDVILGFSTGDIIWFECYSQKYMRLNKQVSSYPSYLSILRLILFRGQSTQRQSKQYAGYHAPKTLL